MLSVRASLLNYQKGVKVNGVELTSPPPKMMEKIVKAQKYAKSQRFATENSRRGNEYSQTSFGFT
jgi:hypothetical protein